MSGVEENTENIGRRERIKLRLKRLTESDLLQAMRETLDNTYDLFRRKLSDYGVETFKASGAAGIIGRMREKFLRIDNLLRSDGSPNYESIIDNLEDIVALGGTALGMFRKELADLDDVKEKYKTFYGDES